MYSDIFPITNTGIDISAENISHYSINNSIAVSGAALLPDSFSVVLTVSELSTSEQYVLVVNGVTDQGSMTKEGYPWGKGEDDLYAIQIKDGATIIAGGLFTGASLFSGTFNLGIELEHGKQYSIEATLVIGGENVRAEPFRRRGSRYPSRRRVSKPHEHLAFDEAP